MLRIGIVAGEASGDYLGAHLIKALKAEHGDIVIEGVGGPKMQEQGCRSIFPMDKLSIMGIVEVLGNYFELVKIRRNLLEYFSDNPPDIFIGIDAPDFNLGLEDSLHQKGILTAHYVSPSVWAWRRHRIKKIASSVDLMLTLFPFELDIYRQHSIRAECVGHPLAEQINMQPDKHAARRRLGLDQDSTIIGIMPGSRRSEMDRLLPPFLETANLCLRESAEVQFISSVLDSNALDYFQQTQSGMSLQDLPLKLYQDKAHDVLEASDVLLLASGTVTLEAALFKKPMVVAYKLNPVTHFFVKMLTYIEHAALPNLLAGTEVVPECLQKKCTPLQLFEHLQYWLKNPGKVSELEQKFVQIHSALRKDSGVLASKAISALLVTK
ncbi:MAG: lipid-A-disaccharide synthase [Gammaproteobacteria bacterium]|jgi:lipid-A-disaccharide synthase|nr:lipid-A-disaccharide synthase [Gammaproteobacteria bacterium]